MNRNKAKSAYQVRTQESGDGVSQKITNTLLVALVLSLGFGQLLRYEVGPITFFVHDLLIVILLIISYRQLLPSLKQSLTTSGIKLLLLGLGLGWLRALTLLPPSELVLPACYSLRLLAYLMLYFTLVHNQFRLNSKYFVIAGSVSLLFGLTQYLVFPDMRVFQYLGWDDHLNRLTIPHFDPTFSGIMLGLFLFFLESNQIILIIMTLVAIALTYSRSVFLSLVVAQVIVRKQFAYLLAILAFVGVTILLQPSRFGEGTNLLRTYSVSSRFAHDLTLLRSAAPNLLTGLGYNTLVSPRLSAKGYPDHADGANNSYLMLLITMGPLGLIGWALFLRHLYAHSSHRAGLLFLLVASIFNNALLYPFALLWILLIEATVPTST